MLRLAIVVTLAWGAAWGRLAEEPVDLDPEALREQVGLVGNGGPKALFVDFSQWALYGPVFEHLRAGGLPEGTRLARLNCAKFWQFCEDALLVQPWDCLRLYLPGSRVSPTAHAAFPLSLLARGNDEELDEPVGLNYLKEFVAVDSRAYANSLVMSWADHIQAGASKPSSAPGVVRVTDENLEQVMRTALEEEGGQVFMLYHGSYIDCADKIAAAIGAQAQLEKLGEWVKSKVIIGLVNCDVHHQPCEVASLAGYCHANHFFKQNACPNNIGGPRGNALYRGQWDEDSIAFNLESRLPDPPARLAITGSGDEL